MSKRIITNCLMIQNFILNFYITSTCTDNTINTNV